MSAGLPLMVFARGRCWSLTALLLAGCATGDTAGGDDSGGAPPSAQDVSDAMRDGLPLLTDPTASYQCALAADLQCTPMRQRGRFRCSYRDASDIRREAVVQRRTPTDYRTAWRWVRGWRRCGILY